MTAAELLKEYRGLRELWLDTGEDRYQVQLAYERYHKQACAEGRPPDSLVRYSGPEDERFFDQIIAGPDGHTYWDGGRRFRLDKGGERLPRYWWYEHVHGVLLERGKLASHCGELNCITPAHQQFVSWGQIKQRYTDQQLIGAVQVVAMRLGHSPTRLEYQSERGRGPTSEILAHRFGGWRSALEAAGLEATPYTLRKITAEDCIKALKMVARLSGRMPTQKYFRVHADQLREAGLPSGHSSIRDHLGTWSEARRKAGLE